MRRRTLVVSAFLAVGVVLSVSLVVVCSEISRARESGSKRSAAQEHALPREETSAAYSQYVDDSAPDVNDPAPEISRTMPRSAPPQDPEGATGSGSEHFVSQGSVAGGPPLREEHFPPYSQIVDNTSQEHFRAHGWEAEPSRRHPYHGNYRVAKSSGKGKVARFDVEIPATDIYSVYAWWPIKKSNNPAARFGVRTTSGVEWTRVNQRRDGGLWVKVGEYRMEPGDRYAVRVSPDSKKRGHVVADAVAVVRGVLSAPPREDHKQTTGAGATTAGSMGTTEGGHIINVARSHMGTPYMHSPPYPCQAHSSEDCSCLTKLVFEKLGIELPDDPAAQWSEGRPVAESDLSPGDLVFFKESGPSGPITHVGIYSGDRNLIHASTYFGRVVESKMSYVKGYYGANRL